MNLSRKRMVVIVIYVLTLVYLLSYLPMVKSFSCGCKIKYTGWFWEKGPLLFDLNPDKNSQPVQSGWSIDWRLLVPKVLVATIIAFLIFICIGDDKSGWREGISNVLNYFTVVMLEVGLLLIPVVMIYAKINGYLPCGSWGEWPGNHGPWHSFLRPSILYSGLSFAFVSLILSFASSILAFITKPSFIKGLVLIVCFISMKLSFNYFYWLIE